MGSTPVRCLFVGGRCYSGSTNRQTETPDSSSRQGDGTFSGENGQPCRWELSVRYGTEFVGLSGNQGLRESWRQGQDDRRREPASGWYGQSIPVGCSPLLRLYPQGRRGGALAPSVQLLWLSLYPSRGGQTCRIKR